MASAVTPSDVPDDSLYTFTMLQNHRLHALDNFRAFLALIGIPFHVAFVLFIGSSQAPIDANHFLMTPAPKVYQALFLAVFYLHTFFMPGFFLLAGITGHLLYERIKGHRFAKNRLIRIGVPFLFFMLWLIPSYAIHACLTASKQAMLHSGSFATVLLTIIKTDYHDGTLWSYLSNTRDKWFLYYLLWFYLLTPALVLLKKCDGFLQKILLGYRAYLIIPTVSALLLMSGHYWFPTLDKGLNLSFILLLFYSIWYVLGWWLWGHKDKIGSYSQHATALLIGSLFLYASYLALYFHFIDQHNIWLHWLTLFTYTLSMSFATLPLIGIAWRYCNHDWYLLDYISQSSYWIYLVKVPMLLIMIPILTQVTHLFYLQFIYGILMCFVLCIASYQLLVRHTFIGKILGSQPTKK